MWKCLRGVSPDYVNTKNNASELLPLLAEDTLDHPLLKGKEVTPSERSQKHLPFKRPEVNFDLLKPAYYEVCFPCEALCSAALELTYTYTGHLPSNCHQSAEVRQNTSTGSS